MAKSEILNLTDINSTGLDMSEFEDREDSFWDWDFDVQLAILTTALVALCLLFTVLSTWIRELLVRRAAQRNETPEMAERRRENMQMRINQAMQQAEHECSICLESVARFPVLTDCGHTFCCECIIQYWRASKTIFSPCDCAMCRSTFHMLLPVNWPTDEENEDAIHENNMRIDDYNRRFSNDRPILDYFRDIPILIPYLLRTIFQHNDNFDVVFQIKTGCMFAMIFLYFILPTDMLPESAYGILGLLDDMILIVVAIGYFIRWFRNYMATRGYAHR